MRLAPPGAGVPAWQRWAGRFILRVYRARLSWEDVPVLLERQGDDLLGLGAGLDESLLTRRVLVPPQIGLEDSSRFYSFAMVLEHLTIVHGGVARIVADLTRGRTPEGTLSTADLKPKGELPLAAAIRDYRDGLAGIRRAALVPAGDRASRASYAHPWFGPLRAHGWLCFAPFHQPIHVRQAREIVRRAAPTRGLDVQSRHARSARPR